MTTISNTNFSASSTIRQNRPTYNITSQSSRNINPETKADLQRSKRSLDQYQKYTDTIQNPRIILNQRLAYSSKIAVHQYATNNNIENIEKRNNLLGFSVYA